MADKLTSYVRGILDRDGLTVDLLAAAQPPPHALDIHGEAPGELVPLDFAALRKVERGQPLSDQERVHLEAVVLPNGLRPAFDISRDSFDPLPDTWKAVNTSRSVLESMIKGIGRVNVAGHPSLQFVGTGFVVASDLLMTNRHVVEYFLDGTHGASSLTFKPGMSSALDFKQEVGSPATLTVRVKAPVVTVDDWDAALLRIDPLPAGVAPLPLAGSPPVATEGRMAVVIGYPAMDPASDLIQQIQIFRGVFDKKRLMPGRLMSLKATTSYGQPVTALGHDCTTLGGNSGSAVIDVARGAVVGLHFAGDYLVANYAVPTWELSRKAVITTAGVSFV